MIRQKVSIVTSKKGEALKWYASKRLGIYILEKDKNKALDLLRTHTTV